MKNLGRSFINKIVIFSAAIRAAAEARQGISGVFQLSLAKLRP